MDDLDTLLAQLIDESYHQTPSVRASAIDRLAVLIPQLTPQQRQLAYEAIGARLRSNTDRKPDTDSFSLRDSHFFEDRDNGINLTLASFARLILEKLRTPEAMEILLPYRKQSLLYLPNKWAGAYFNNFVEIAGKPSLLSLFGLGNLNHVGWQHFPPDNMKCEIDFVDIATFNKTLIELYGSRGGKGLQEKIGTLHLSTYLPEIFPLLPDEGSPGDKLYHLLELSGKMWMRHSDIQCRIERTATGITLTMITCPYCWNIEEPEPVCYALVGLLSEAVREIDPDFDCTISETACCAMGDQHCIFEIQFPGIARN